MQVFGGLTPPAATARSWRFGSRRPWMLTLAAGAVAIGTAVALVARSSSPAAPAPYSPSSAPLAAAPATVSEAWPAPDLSSRNLADVSTIAVVAEGGVAPAVALLDVANGETLVSTETSYNPVVTFRRSRDELLLTHQVAFEWGGSNHALDVLDFGGLTLKRRIPIGNRPNYKVTMPVAWQAVSVSERYFAVYHYTFRDELPECQTRPADGPSCTRSHVRVIDLDSAGPDEWLFELPRHCFGGLSTHGTDGFVASCGDGFYAVEVTGIEPIASAPAPRYLTDPVQARNLANGVLWMSPGDGWFGTLMSDGSFTWTREGDLGDSRRAVPPGRQLRWPIFAEVVGGRLVTGFVDRYYDQYPLGLSVFNLQTGELEAELPAFNIARSVIAGNSGELLAATQDGRLIAIDVSAGTERTIASLGADPESVVLVR